MTAGFSILARMIFHDNVLLIPILYLNDGHDYDILKWGISMGGVCGTVASRYLME